MHTQEWYDDHDVDLRLGATVTSVDPAARTVTAGADVQPYDALLLATGARARALPMADDSGAPVHYLRTIEDSDRLRALLTAGTRLALVGGGWIGLEVAAAAVAAGAQVTVLESAELPLVRVLGPEVAARFASAAPRATASTSACGSRSRRSSRRRAAPLLRLADGTAVEADHVLVGIGAVPNTDLAAAAGLTVDNGIRTDEHLRTSVPDVYAAGDVANALPPGARAPCQGRALGQRHPAGRGRGAEPARPAGALRRGCRTSSPTSTTSAWSTSAASGRTGTTR